MNRIVKVSLVIFLLLQPYYAANTAPDYSFEGLLPRAQTIFIGHITKYSQPGLTFEIDEVLRGTMPQKTVALGFTGLDDLRLSGVPGSSYLVISQGDNHFGKPKAVVSLGQPLKGQAGFCGWIAFPLRRRVDNYCLDLIYTRLGQKPVENPARLMLEMARALILQVPFKADLHDNGRSNK